MASNNGGESFGHKTVVEATSNEAVNKCSLLNILTTF